MFPPDRLPQDIDSVELRKEARALLDAYEALLAHPAFVHRVGVSVLAKIAADEQVPPRERRRAAEVLGRLHLLAMKQFAELAGVREQVLDRLGLSPPPAGPAAVAVAQVSTKVEIVREKDWRDAETGEDHG